MTRFYNLQSVKVAKTYFTGNTSVVNIDCNGLDFTGNDAEEAFRDCSELVSVTNLPNTLTKMKSAFRNCQKMITPPVIPSSVTNMTYTFYDCRGMTSVPDLSNCTSLTTIERCFAYNYELLETPVVPNSVTNMKNICQGCKKITSLPNIPNGVTDLAYAFDQCLSVIKCNREIPSQITNMNHTFSRCTSLKGRIVIRSENITDATDCFVDTTLSKTVYIPFQNNGVDTATYTAFTAAGYDDLGITCGVTLADISTYTPPIHYNLPEEMGQDETFTWTDDLTVAQQKTHERAGDVTTNGISCGQNMSVSGTTISHTSNNETSPGEESYVAFVFNVNEGLFKPKTLSFDVCKNGTNGGSVQVAVYFSNLGDEEIICNLPTIARNSEDPNYTHTEIDLTTFNFGACDGTAIVKFYLYNQGNTKTFSLFNVSLTGLLSIRTGYTPNV